MERFGIMTDEEYARVLANYDNLTHHEKLQFVRRVVSELQTYLQAKDNLEDIASIRQFVRLLPTIQQRQARMSELTQQLNSFKHCN